MKHIALLRHADAMPAGGSPDLARELSTHGMAQVQALAARLLQRGEVPDYIIASAALRAQQTARLLLQATHWPLTLHTDATLYNAATPELVSCLQSLPETVTYVLLVGHNPTITDAAHYLSGHYLPGIPTAGWVLLHTEKSWTKLTATSCRYLAHDFGE